MEDAHTTRLNLETEDGKHISFFAVFDGHGGTYAAKYSDLNVYLNVMETPEFQAGDYKTALKKGFNITDDKLLVGIIII